MLGMTAGFDEVGRGAWAGPLVVAGVALAGDTDTNFRDSKHYSKSAREAVLLEVYAVADQISISVIQPQRIDEIGLGSALKLAFNQAASGLRRDVDEYIVDGAIDYLKLPNSRAEPKADDNYQSVAASSIIAKVHRDWYMQRLNSVGIDYGFDRHFGYGTKLHKQNLLEFGVGLHHRRSFKPIQKLL